MARSAARTAKGVGAAGESAANGPRWASIAEDIAREIESGGIGDGTALPAAAAVAERYGVHRHTVRQAFRHLQDLGLVSVERGRGTIVTGKRFPYRIGRRVSFRTNFGSEGIAASGVVLATTLAEADAATARALGISAGEAVWEIRKMSRAAGVPVSASVHRLCVRRFPEFDARIREARASTTAAFRSYGIEDYVRLSTRLTARMPTAAERRILEIGRGLPVMQSTAIDGLDDGTPLQLVVSAFAADRVEFVIETEPNEGRAGRPRRSTK